jgi:para-nitrobenzyl esterase
MMKDLGLAPNDLASLQKMEWSKLVAAGNAAISKINPPMRGALGPFAPGPPRVGWAPTLDGKIINVRSFFDVAPEVSKNVPMLLGSVSEEGNQMHNRPTEEEWHANLVKAYGEDKATALVTTLKKAHPEKSIRTLSYMCSGAFGLNSLTMRNNIVKMARLKHEQKGAPAYAYYFTWQSPMLEDAGAWHTAELQFCFDNTKRCEQGTGDTPEAQALAKKMGTAWANFAGTGNPSQPGLEWAPTDPDSNKTMILDNHCRMENDPESESRKILVS